MTSGFSESLSWRSHTSRPSSLLTSSVDPIGQIRYIKYLSLLDLRTS